MRDRLHAKATGLLCAGLLLASSTGADTSDRTEVWLRQGGDIAVSTTVDGSRIFFSMVDRVWSMDPKDGFATQLTDDDEIARRPVVSPDEKLIAYATMRGGFHQIMVRDADGGMPRQITFGEFNHRSPSWSRDSAARPFNGNRLIMASDRGGRYGIWEIDVDTLDLQQLTFAGSDEHEPAWNDDGTRIAYVTDTPTGSALYSVSPGEKPQLLLKENARIRAPTWRPGGGLLTYVRQLHGENQLRMLILSQPVITKPITQGEVVFPYPAVWLDRSRFMYTADGYIRQRVFGKPQSAPVAFNARLEIATQPWTRRQLSFDTTGNRPVKGNNGHTAGEGGRHIVATLGDLWEIRPDGTLARQLTNDPFVDAHPALSPDGASVAFISDRSGSLQVWLKDLGTMRTRRLTQEHGIAVNPAWVDAGAAIEYLSAAHPAAANFVRKRVDVETGNVNTVAGTPDDVETVTLAKDSDDAAVDIPLSWRPVTANGRMIVRAGRIFDGIGPGYLIEHEIVIDDDRITAVRPWTTGAGKINSDNDSVLIIDATRQTIIPGLIDMSVRQAHIGDERLGRKYLAYGVTTIREAVTAPAEAIERQESWSSSRRIGPRLLLTSTLCNDTSDGLTVRPVLEPAVAQRAFRARINAAIDLGSVSIGVCRSLNAGTRGDVIATVHGRGLPVMTGEAFPDILLGANETRLPPPELASYDDFSIVSGTLGTTVTSNLALTGLPILIQAGELTGGWQYQQVFTGAEHEWYEQTWNLSESALAELQIRSNAINRGLVAALARGARIVTGSDTPRVPPGLGLHAELRLLTRAGLQPFQALRMATLDAGRALGAENDLGTIRPGAFADLVIVDGDPLQDIRDAARISMTIARGRPLTRRELSSPGHRPPSVGNLYN